MIKQPDLGKKIADLRKSKGYTQEELVERCNLSVRTLQRIEAGEVTPRIYTIKLILEVLELDIENSLWTDSENKDRMSRIWYDDFLDLFNAKTNKAGKQWIFFLVFIVIVAGILIPIYIKTKNRDNRSYNEPKFEKSATAKWIEYPKNFTEFKKEFSREAEWKPSNVKIFNGKYIINVGPYYFKYPNDSICDYYCIDIEEPLDQYNSIVITELNVDLKYVSKNLLNSKADEIVRFDSKKNIITFDLGNSIFTCKLKPKSKK